MLSGLTARAIYKLYVIVYFCCYFLSNATEKALLKATKNRLFEPVLFIFVFSSYYYGTFMCHTTSPASLALSVVSYHSTSLPFTPISTAFVVSPDSVPVEPSLK